MVSILRVEFYEILNHLVEYKEQALLIYELVMYLWLNDTGFENACEETET